MFLKRRFPSSNVVNLIKDTASKLNIDHDEHLKIGYAADHQPVSVVSECKCDMPPCICEAPAPFVDALPMQV